MRISSPLSLLPLGAAALFGGAHAAAGAEAAIEDSRANSYTLLHRINSPSAQQQAWQARAKLVIQPAAPNVPGGAPRGRRGTSPYSASWENLISQQDWEALQGAAGASPSAWYQVALVQDATGGAPDGPIAAAKLVSRGSYGH